MFHVLHNPSSAIASIFFIITANKGRNHWSALLNHRQQKQAENICHKMSRIYLRFTNLRTLFLTISEVQVSLIFRGTLNSMCEHSSTSHPTLLVFCKQSHFNFPPLILTSFSPLPHSSREDHCHYIPNTGNVFSRPSHKGYEKEASRKKPGYTRWELTTLLTHKDYKAVHTACLVP